MGILPKVHPPQNSKKPVEEQRREVRQQMNNNYTKPKSPQETKEVKNYQTLFNNSAINKHLNEVMSRDHKPKNSMDEKSQTPVKAGGRKDKYWYLDGEMQEPPPPVKEPDTSCSLDEMAELQTKHVAQPYSGLHQLRKYAAEEDASMKQKQEVMEQVLLDQLSRHVISDVEQDADPDRLNPCDPTSTTNATPLRFRSRRLHNTKVSTVGATTVSTLKDRSTFGARVVTRDGRDALRELFGFYFHVDQTLTVYEYRLFGKNTNKAMPLVERGKYSHVIGRRKGKRYSPADFELGRNLSFSTAGLTHLPDSLKQQPTLVIRICEASSTGGSQWDSSYRNDGSDTSLEQNDRKIMEKVQTIIRGKIGSRSVSVVVGLGQLFRQLDRSGDGKLDKEELLQALASFGLMLPQQDFESVWRVVDENNDGVIDYGEFMRSFIGEMNETRRAVVRKVYRKLDPRKCGFVNLLDLQKLYRARNHPLVANGNVSESELLRQMKESFAQLCHTDAGNISYVEFTEYYEGVSLTVPTDADFINMMRNCWGV